MELETELLNTDQDADSTQNQNPRMCASTESNKNKDEDTFEWTQIRDLIFPNGELPNNDKQILNDIASRKFIIFSSSSYYYGQNSNFSSKEQSFFNPAEFAFATFSFQEGLKQVNHGIIDPGFDTGCGYSSAISESSKKYGIPEPTQSPIDRRKIYKGLIEPFLKVVLLVNKLSKEEAGQDTLVFVPTTCPDQLNMASDCFKFCSVVTGEKLPTLHFLSMAELYRFVVNESMGVLGRNEKLTLKMSESVLSDTKYEYSADLGCEHHRNEEYQDHVIYCSKNVVVRSIYYVLDRFYKTFGGKRQKKNDRPRLEKGLSTLEKGEMDMLLLMSAKQSELLGRELDI